jgi:hypothetical protein
MQKKKYIKPEMEELEFQQEGALLQASSPDDEWNGDFGYVNKSIIDKRV